MATLKLNRDQFRLNGHYVGGKTTLIRECIKLIVKRQRLTRDQAIAKFPKELNGSYDVIVKHIKKEGRYSKEKIKCEDGFIYVTNQWGQNNYKKIVLIFKSYKYINIKKA